MIQSERFRLILNFRLYQDSLNLVIWIKKKLIDKADVMSVESNMIILRTHVIFQKLSQNFNVLFKV